MGDREYQAVETVKEKHWLAPVTRRFTRIWRAPDRKCLDGNARGFRQHGRRHRGSTTAALFGEDDYDLALEYKPPLVPTLDDGGKFLPFVEVAAGLFYKSRRYHQHRPASTWLGVQAGKNLSLLSFLLPLFDTALLQRGSGLVYQCSKLKPDLIAQTKISTGIPNISNTDVLAKA